MAGTSLYRRHRPASFADVVGQEHIVRTLSNAIDRDKVHHAYLFVGSRGTGKTSMAKILARSLNCAQGPTTTPCGECEACRAIAAGTSMDVIEMDAASNRSVDDVRELRERVAFAPAQGRWKVYILDEAHMLTREAWNAFLKTLEEPPPNTVFVLATTEPHKVMPTIVDRCQRFDFRRPTPEQVAEVVSRVAGVEAIEISDGAVAAIARAARGSFRDALGTLDQLTSFSGAEIATEDVLSMLGIADAELLYRAADAIAGSDTAAVLELTAGIFDAGHDPSQFAAELAEHLRRLLVARTIGEVPEALLASAEESDRLAEQAGRATDAMLVRGIDCLWDAVAQIREGDDPRLALELALIKAVRADLDPGRRALVQRIERLEDKSGAPPAAVPEAGPAETSVDVAAGVAAIAERAGRAADEVRSRVEEVIDSLDAERVVEVWPAVMEQLRESSDLLSTALQSARPLEVDAERSLLKVGFPADHGFHRRTAETPSAREDLTEAIKAIVGRTLKPVFVMLEEDSTSDAEAGGLSEEELLARFKDEFGAEEIDEQPATEAAGAQRAAAKSRTQEG